MSLVVLLIGVPAHNLSVNMRTIIYIILLAFMMEIMAPLGVWAQGGDSPPLYTDPVTGELRSRVTDCLAAQRELEQLSKEIGKGPASPGQVRRAEFLSERIAKFQCPPERIPLPPKAPPTVEPPPKPAIPEKTSACPPQRRATDVMRRTKVIPGIGAGWLIGFLIGLLQGEKPADAAQDATVGLAISNPVGATAAAVGATGAITVVLIPAVRSYHNQVMQQYNAMNADMCKNVCASNFPGRDQVNELLVCEALCMERRGSPPGISEVLQRVQGFRP